MTFSKPCSSRSSHDPISHAFHSFSMQGLRNIRAPYRYLIADPTLARYLIRISKIWRPTTTKDAPSTAPSAPLSTRGIADQIVSDLVLRNTCFGPCPGAHGDTGLMNRIGVARDQRMPPLKILAFSHEPVGATCRQPAKKRYGFWCNPSTIRYPCMTIGIVATPAGANIEQPAGQPSMNQFAGIFVFKFNQTTLTATVAKRLPFIRRQIV